MSEIPYISMNKKTLAVAWVTLLTFAIGLGGWMGRSREVRKDSTSPGTTAAPVSAPLGHPGQVQAAQPTAAPLFEQPRWAEARPPKPSFGTPPAFSDITATALLGRRGAMDFSSLRKGSPVRFPVEELRELESVVLF